MLASGKYPKQLALNHYPTPPKKEKEKKELQSNKTTILGINNEPLSLSLSPTTILGIINEPLSFEALESVQSYYTTQGDTLIYFLPRSHSTLSEASKH